MPCPSRTSTRPATDSGRSSQERITMPPYGSTLSRRQLPAEGSSACRRSFSVGESLWPAAIMKP